MVKSGADGLRAMIQRVPLAVRMIIYSTLFLAGVLGGLPWLAHRVDVQFPRWHFEICGWRYVGAVVTAAFFGFYAMASMILTRRGRGAYVEFDPPKEFVATGLYEYMRNPIAAALVGTIFGEALLFSSTGIFLLFCAGLLLAHVQVVFLEEPLLRRRFGQTYADYCRRVPRWIPRAPRPPRKARP